MNTTKGELRVYPIGCLSAYCGEVECPADCRRLDNLRAFKAWRERTKAERADPIWCPAVWTATR